MGRRVQASGLSLWLRSLLVSASALTAATLCALVGSAFLLHESSSSVWTIVISVLISGFLALGVGLVMVLFGMQFLPRLSLKVGGSYLVGSLVAIITIVYTPLVMFKRPSDAHLLILLLLCFLVISLGLAATVTFSVTGYLHALREAAGRVSAGQFDTRVEVLSGDELSELATAFNRMSEELGRSTGRERAQEQARRNLVAAISHDLGTPLTAVRSMVEAIRDGIVRDAEIVAGYLDRMHEELLYLDRLIDELFDLSRFESGSSELDTIPVNLYELVTETIEGLRLLAAQKDLDLSMEAPPELPLVPLDPTQIQRVVTNLTHNAIRYTPAGGTIRVAMRAGVDEATVEVVDDGEGIPAEDIPFVFDRLYRGEKSRTRQGNGTGLGLAIAKAIVEAHDGRIRVENVQPHGARFVFTLPLTPTP